MGDLDAAPTHVIDHVFLGSKINARDREQLQQLRITHILNVTPTKTLDPVAGVPNFFEKDKIFEYRRCAIFDNKAEDISGALEGCVAFIEQAKFYGRVFVHCSKGVSRSVSMVIAYLIKSHGMSYQDALQLVQSKRNIAQPNPSFEKQLIAYAARMERLRKRKELDSKRTAIVWAGPSARGPPQAAASIGPQLPPHLAKRHQNDEKSGVPSDQEETKASEYHDEQLSSETTPQLPTNLKRKHDGHIDASKEEKGKKQRAGPMIGPARLPQEPATE